MIEMMIVLFIISIISLLSINNIYGTYEKLSLNGQINLLSDVLIRAKYDSFYNHEYNNVYVYEEYIEYDNYKYQNYDNVRSDDEYVVTYNENGNIQKAMTITYKINNIEKQLVLWIGGGYFEER